MPKSGGSVANTTGHVLENFLVPILRNHDYVTVAADRFDLAQCLEQKIYARQYRTGTNIYGGMRKVDFILYDPVRHPNTLVIQCKWQASSGSVQEKYPYEKLCIDKNQLRTIILIDGGGYTKGALQWLKDHAGPDQYLNHVFSQGEFSRWSKNNL